jgi:hypothetical protein
MYLGLEGRVALVIDESRCTFFAIWEKGASVANHHDLPS